jgi:hypothetical protein
VGKRNHLLPAAILLCAALVRADDLPENDIQAAFNGYFDNFRVNVLYPTVSFTRRISPSASVTGRYLADCITAASMRSRFAIDGVTSATSKYDKDGVPGGASVDGVTAASAAAGNGPGESTFDEVRHEFNAGLARLLGEGMLTVNAIYSTENDYRSLTAAGQISVPFALKNTTVQLGLVRSWDRVSPDTRDWTKRKNVITGSAGLTQVLTERLIVQANASVTRMTGYLSDPYQPVPVFTDGSFVYRETRLPDSRTRNAAGLRANWLWSDRSSIQAGYRYYWDDWGIRSNTMHALAQTTFADGNVILGASFRRYLQNRASFFRAEYGTSDGFLTVDTKLNMCRSNEWGLDATVKGDYFKNRGRLSFLAGERMEYKASFALYMRHSADPDWFSGMNDLIACITSIGLRVRLE